MVGITVLGSGSKGNAVVVHGRDHDLLVDAGFSLRELRRRMVSTGVDETRISAILVTHEHGDHCRGLGVVARKLELPIFCTRGTGQMLRERNLVGESLHLFAPGGAFEIGEFTINPFSIPHDAVDPCGFTLTARGVKVGVATDLGHTSGVVCHHLRECDALLVESNHDIPMVHRSNRPWRLKQRILGRHGHLSNDDSMELIRKVIHERTQHLILGHTSCECNTYELVADMAERNLADLGRPDIVAAVAVQDESLPTIWLGRS